MKKRVGGRKGWEFTWFDFFLLHKVTKSESKIPIKLLVCPIRQCLWLIDSKASSISCNSRRTELFLVEILFQSRCHSPRILFHAYQASVLNYLSTEKERKKSIRNWSLRGLSLWRKIVFLSLNLPYQSKAKPDEEKPNQNTKKKFKTKNQFLPVGYLSSANATSPFGW